ncbi:hypothetical protein FFLO_05085 [Filobasidium floriforme]|uniref:TATA-binding protein interacting (TIP20) domain-containing protein n=1 Tax=Filobasidium floriforme TaxID=5210 RepID=A0A8K0JI55_9TREE|nr:armadillo-type protein [Filobasidium floriforme]KAG7530369.1 hypothetical protein FFLO_05085 [Filobasidium floriforme]KAH8080662.1 armadillo-type protein [Filobasidium floriforme]
MPSVLTYTYYQQMLDKLKSSDPDFRCMAIIDFQKEAKQIGYRIEDSVEKDLFKEILKLVLEDGNTEVKNMAAQCLATLTYLSQKPGNIVSAVDSLLKSSNTGEEEQRDIATLALKNMLVELHEQNAVVLEVIDKVIQGVCKQLQNNTIPTQHAVELLDILSLIFTRFSAQLSTKPALQTICLSVLLHLLSSSRPHIRKRSIVALGYLVPTSTREVFKVLSERLIGVLGDGTEEMETEEDEGIDETVKKTAYAALVGTLGKTSPAKVGKILQDVVPGILSLSEATEEEDALEASMTTLEILVVRCPTEITPFLTQITARASGLLKYDPNYAGGDDDEDDEMEADDEDELDEDFDEDYSDDEDASWKARRSAAKLLQALISTRIELLNDWYASVAPLLTSRLSEREESVRLEVFAAWEALLKQTGLYGGSNYVSAGEAPTGLKRKRLDSQSNENVFTTSPLASQTVPLTRAALKQTTTKSVPTKEKSFNLLTSVVKLIPGCLDGQASTVVGNVRKALSGVSTGSGGHNNTSLVISILAFLGAFVESHPSRIYASSLPELVDSTVAFMADKYQRVSLEALGTAASLAKALRPEPASQGDSPLPSSYVAPVQKLYEAVCDIVSSTAADSDVRDKAIHAIGDLLTHEGEVLASMYDKSLPLITARLNTDSNQLAALEVIGDIAESRSCSGAQIEQWLASVLEQFPALLRRCPKQNRGKALSVLETLLTRFGDQLPADVASSIVTELKSYVTVQDLHNLGATMHVVAQLQKQQPALREHLETEVLPAIQEAIQSPLLHSAALEGIQDFFAVFVRATPEGAQTVVPKLFKLIARPDRSIPTAEDGGTQAFANVAKCIGTAVENSQSSAKDIVADFIKFVKKGETGTDAELYLSLLILGEIGRTTDVSQAADVYQAILKLFAASSEQIKSAAAFAAGNIAVGNTAAFLPVIVKGVAEAETPAARLLYLHALKEAIVHCSDEQIVGIADSLWEPLLADDDDSQDDGARNVKAACIGKLTSANPSKYIPELRARLPTASPVVKATIVASTRYTLTDSSTAGDEVLAPAIYDFLALMQDSDHVVRRLAVSSTNAAAQYKPQLIINQLASLMPMLYAETEVKKELIREYQMGPFVVKMDDGLNNRKGAFEAMQTLLNTCFTKMNANELFDIILVGLADFDEVKLLALMMLQRLAALAEGIVAARLDDLVESIENIAKPIVAAKDDTEQDVQRKEDSQKTAIGCIAPLAEISTPQTCPKFDKLINELARDAKWHAVFEAAHR